MPTGTHWNAHDEAALARTIESLLKERELSSMDDVLERTPFFKEVSEKLKDEGVDRTFGACKAKLARARYKEKARMANEDDSDSSGLSDFDTDFEIDDVQIDDNMADNKQLSRLGYIRRRNPTKTIEKPAQSAQYADHRRWSEEEETIVYEAIKKQLDKEDLSKVRPSSQEQLWQLAIEALKSKNHSRSKCSIRYYWSTYGAERRNLESVSGVGAYMDGDGSSPASQIRNFEQLNSLDSTTLNQLEHEHRRSMSKAPTFGSNTIIVVSDVQFSPNQLAHLEAEFVMCNHVTPESIKQLVLLTGLDTAKIKAWFSNKRESVKHRNSYTASVPPRDMEESYGRIKRCASEGIERGQNNSDEIQPLKKARHSDGEDLLSRLYHGGKDGEAAVQVKSQHSPFSSISPPETNVTTPASEAQGDEGTATQGDSSILSYKTQFEQIINIAREKQRQVRSAINAHRDTIKSYESFIVAEKQAIAEKEAEFLKAQEKERQSKKGLKAIEEVRAALD